MDIMITGASGFIGNRLMRQLLKRGNQINVLCRKTSDISELSGTGLKIFFGDITDYRSIEECMKGCEQVYHLAAYAKNWAKKSSTYYKYNTDAVKGILDSSLKNGVKKVLFISTSVTLGSSTGIPVDEKCTRAHMPFTFYEDSKIKAEKIILEYSGRGVEVVTVNPTRIFGPGLLTEGNSVTKMIDLYLKGRFRFIPGDGNAAGNYAYINDVVDGCINAMKWGRNGEKYILGGENLTYNEFFSIIAEQTGNKRTMYHLPGTAAMILGYAEEARAKLSNHYPLITPGWIKTFVVNWAFSCSKAINEINYRITPFNEALKNTLEWIYNLTQESSKKNENIKFA
jgi:nucleoside-diphosphate-sugar epimerase